MNRESRGWCVSLWSKRRLIAAFAKLLPGDTVAKKERIEERAMAEVGEV